MASCYRPNVAKTEVALKHVCIREQKTTQGLPGSMLKKVEIGGHPGRFQQEHTVPQVNKQLGRT
jgi:hypothetical protein